MGAAPSAPQPPFAEASAPCARCGRRGSFCRTSCSSVWARDAAFTGRGAKTRLSPKWLARSVSGTMVAKACALPLLFNFWGKKSVGTRNFHLAVEQLLLVKLSMYTAPRVKAFSKLPMEDGNKDHHLRHPSSFILTHTQMDGQKGWHQASKHHKLPKQVS